MDSQQCMVMMHTVNSLLDTTHHHNVPYTPNSSFPTKHNLITVLAFPNKQNNHFYTLPHQNQPHIQCHGTLRIVHHNLGGCDSLLEVQYPLEHRRVLKPTRKPIAHPLHIGDYDEGDVGSADEQSLERELLLRSLSLHHDV